MSIKLSDLGIRLRYIENPAKLPAYYWQLGDSIYTTQEIFQHVAQEWNTNVPELAKDIYIFPAHTRSTTSVYKIQFQALHVWTFLYCIGRDVYCLDDDEILRELHYGLPVTELQELQPHQHKIKVYQIGETKQRLNKALLIYGGLA